MPESLFDNGMWELYEISSFIKNKLKAKERSSFMLSRTSDQYQDCTTVSLLVKGSVEHKRACVFYKKENHLWHKCLKVSDPKNLIFYITPKKALLYIC